MELYEYKTVRELLQLDEESARNEFKPKFGNGAKRGGKDNEKAVKDILKAAEEYDSKARTERTERKPEVEFPDYNKTTLDVNFEYEPSKQWKERVKKLATVGTESDVADCNSTDGNVNFYNARKKASEDRDDREYQERSSGLKARLKTNVDYHNKTAFLKESTASGVAGSGLPGEFTAPVFGDKETMDRTPGNTCGMHDKTGDSNLNEEECCSQNVYTMEDWERDGSFSIKPGQAVDYNVINELVNEYPPIAYQANYIQHGETVKHDSDGKPLYHTFTRDCETCPWIYAGLCPEESCEPSQLNENKPTKRLKFKNTVFLDERQVIKKVPEDYKINENRFYMQDKTGTDYLVECKMDQFGCMHLNAIRQQSKSQIKDELNEMKRLYGYSYSNDNKTVDKSNIGDMSETINNFRKLLSK